MLAVGVGAIGGVTSRALPLVVIGLQRVPGCVIGGVQEGCDLLVAVGGVCRDGTDRSVGHVCAPGTRELQRYLASLAKEIG
jgi:hypothetical protein